MAKKSFLHNAFSPKATSSRAPAPMTTEQAEGLVMRTRCSCPRVWGGTLPPPKCPHCQAKTLLKIRAGQLDDL